MVAILDIFQLSPDFQSAVVAVHDVTLPIALVCSFGGFMMLTIAAFQERSMHNVWVSMVKILAIALFLANMPTIGNWIEQVVLQIEQASGVGNGTAFSDYLGALKQKFGVDLTALNSLVPQGPFANPIGAATAPGGVTVSTFGAADDPNLDTNTANGIGNHNNQLVSGAGGQSIGLSPDLAAGLTPGQQITVNLTNGQTVSGTFDDTTAASFNGQALHRVDIFDPNHQFDALSGVGVASINGGALPNSGNPVGDFFNGLIHPLESVQIGFFGMIVLFISYIAVAIWWAMALLQSVLFYCEIALAPLFVGWLLVRGFEGVGRTFLMSFLAICLWPLAFLVIGLVTKFIIAMALNTGNNGALGAINTAGVTYFWLILLALWAGFGAIFGPWILSKAFVRGVSGIEHMIVGTRGFGGSVVNTGSRAVSAVSAPVSVASSSAMNMRPMFAGRPRSPRI